jgi:hypothetical protein
VKALRIVPVVAVVAALVALTSWWGGTEQPVRSSLRPLGVPAAQRDDALSSTWFCASGGAPTTDRAEHHVILVNPSDEPVTARLSGFDADGPVGSEVVEVAARGQGRISVSERFGTSEVSVMVESLSPGLAVEHRLLADDGGDLVPCLTGSSDRWYFPAHTTSLEQQREGALANSARLVLFNPFSSDASVDLVAAVDDGIRAPGEWAGLVVPAGTTRTIDLGEQVQRRDLFALTVTLRSGRVVAETVQTFVHDDEVAGLRLQPGVPAPQSRWGFATGFTGRGAQEQLVVHNPGDETASVVVQVTPIGGAEMPPEPFELDVASGRYRVIELSEEGRVPGVGHHSIQVETSTQTPVVVGRVVRVTQGPQRPEPVEGQPEVVARISVGGGTTIGTGSPLLSTRWVVPFLRSGEGQDSSVSVHNPGTEPVRVSAVTLGGEGDPVDLAEEVEVPPGDGIVLRLADHDVDPSVAVEVRSSSPVLVERTISIAELDDLAMGLAIPYPPGGDGAFPRLAER